jgi:hypothetical protein
MKNLILLLILINPFIGYTQYPMNGYIIIKDTTKYLMTSNKFLTNGINQYYKQSRTGQHQTLLGTSLTTLGALLISPTINKPTEKLPYILITTGLTFNIVGSINRYLAYKHLDNHN